MGANPALSPQLTPMNILPAISISYDLAEYEKPSRIAPIIANMLLTISPPFLKNKTALK
jgi:hypothetical protein